MITKDYNGIHLATYAECKKLNGGKWFCPDCGKKTFVCYLDCDGEIINEKVGKCDRADKCNYHYTPKEYFSDNGNDRPITPRRPTPTFKPEPPPTYINPDIFKQTLKAYHRNNFIRFLNRVFNPHLVDGAIKEYFVGTSNHFCGGATVFWQIDHNGNIHGGKIMKYNPNNGKRVKITVTETAKDGTVKTSKKALITWVHSVMKLPDYNLKQCLFGEHLLRKYPDHGVAVVESEKTAIIASMWYPDSIFLACGGCQNLTHERCIPLKERRVVFFPDNGKYEEWREKAKELSHLFKSFVVSDIMEHEAVEQGDDIGDLILRNVNNKDLSIPPLETAPSETPENAVEEREEEQRTTEPEEREHAPEHTTNNGIEQSIINQFKATNPSFAYLCERLDLVSVGTETAPSGHQTFIAVDEKTYYFDEHGIFHFYRTPEQEQMMKRFHKADVCPF